MYEEDAFMERKKGHTLVTRFLKGKKNHDTRRAGGGGGKKSGYVSGLDNDVRRRLLGKRGVTVGRPTSGDLFSIPKKIIDRIR